RSVRVSLTDKGREVAEVVSRLYDRHIGSIEQVGGIKAEEFRQMNRALHRLDRFWNDPIAYRVSPMPFEAGGDRPERGNIFKPASSRAPVFCCLSATVSERISSTWEGVTLIT